MRYPEAEPKPDAKTSTNDKPLTDREVASLKPKQGKRWDRFDAGPNRVRGLAIRVGLGAKSWVLFYRRHVEKESGGWEATSEQRRWTFGTYPSMGLGEARRKADAALRDLRTKGIDPADGKREARTGSTFGDLADEYIKRHAKTKKRSWEQDERTLEIDVLPEWKSRPAKAISRRDVHALIDRIVDRGAPIMANRVLALVRKVFNYGVQKDWLDGNPASLIPKQPETSRDRVLTDDEIEALWKALEAPKSPKRVTEADETPAISAQTARGLQMILLTAQRPGEVFRMRWEDVDGVWWTIPAKATKNGEPHRVPLTQRAVKVLAEAKAANPGNNLWVFSGTQGASVISRAKKSASALRTAKAIEFDFHRHDLRRTAATGMAKAGISRETIARVLNHVDRGSRATAVYDKYSYDAEKRSALDAWGRQLDAVLRGRPGRHVVPFKRSSRRVDTDRSA